jgi:hypothetical protein
VLCLSTTCCRSLPVPLQIEQLEDRLRAAESAAAATAASGVSGPASAAAAAAAAEERLVQLQQQLAASRTQVWSSACTTTAGADAVCAGHCMLLLTFPLGCVRCCCAAQELLSIPQHSLLWTALSSKLTYRSNSVAAVTQSLLVCMPSVHCTCGVAGHEPREAARFGGGARGCSCVTAAHSRGGSS